MNKKNNEIIIFKGEYLIEGYNKKGKKIFSKKYSNTTTHRLYEFIIDQIGDFDPVIVAPNYVYIALGTGTQQANKLDTTLENELFRKQITQKRRTTNKFIYSVYLLGEDANFHLKEIGTFLKANITANSGMLISRANIDIDKNSSIQYLITFTLTIK